jgi:periplasmic protein CpxP/Spy
MSYIRNNRILLLITSVLLVANIGLLYFFVFDKKSPPPHKPPTDEQIHTKAREEVMEEGGLDAQQAVAYDSLRTQQFRTMKPLFKDITKSKEDFFSLIYQQGVSDSVLNSYASKIGEKQMELDISTFHYFQSIKALCNEEQKPKMDSFIKQIIKRIINNNGPRRPSDKKENKQ